MTQPVISTSIANESRPEYIDLRVRQIHIDRSVDGAGNPEYCNSRSCPIARALHGFGYARAIVGPDRASGFTADGEVHYYLLGAAGREFLRHYDNRANPGPCMIKLFNVSESVYNLMEVRKL